MRFTTESGTVYEVNGDLVRRVGNDPMRGDGEWLRLVVPTRIEVGKPVHMLLEPLAEYGPDSNGSTLGGTTSRRTTTVVSVDE